MAAAGRNSKPPPPASRKRKHVSKRTLELVEELIDLHDPTWDAAAEPLADDAAFESETRGYDDGSDAIQSPRESPGIAERFWGM